MLIIFPIFFWGMDKKHTFAPPINKVLWILMVADWKAGRWIGKNEFFIIFSIDNLQIR
jgi:hypothetical protein